MIIGITGAICSGKRAFAEYLAAKYGFVLVNLIDLFYIELQKQGIAVACESSPAKNHNSQDSNDEEAKMSQDSKDNNPEEEEIEMEALKMHRVNSTGETSSTSQLSYGGVDSVFNQVGRSQSAKVNGEKSNEFGDSFIFQYYQCKEIQAPITLNRTLQRIEGQDCQAGIQAGHIPVE